MGRRFPETISAKDVADFREISRNFHSPESLIFIKSLYNKYTSIAPHSQHQQFRIVYISQQYFNRSSLAVPLPYSTVGTTNGKRRAAGTAIRDSYRRETPRSVSRMALPLFSVFCDVPLAQEVWRDQPSLEPRLGPRPGPILPKAYLGACSRTCIA